jgi:GMP synthase-like glutamine amidotransferase
MGSKHRSDYFELVRVATDRNPPLMPVCLVVQHAEPERPYAIGEALAGADVEVVVFRVYAGEPLPERIGDAHGLVIMGGPMSAAHDDGFPTRRQEMQLLAEAVELRLPTLGVCLGAQLLAGAIGGRVVPSPIGPEIGWAPVQLGSAATNDPLFSGLPRELTVLHWHGDTYELPPSATHLASSSSHREQAFRVGDMAWGLQFHIEVDEAAVEAFLEHFGDEAEAAGSTVDTIRSATQDALAALSPSRTQVLTRFSRLVAAAPWSVERAPVDALADGP